MLSYSELLHPADIRVKRILEAAEKNFLAHGLHKSHIEQICNDAGMSKPTFYKYFDKKETLFFAVLIHLQRSFYEAFTMQSKEKNKATDRLRLYIELYEQHFRNNKLLTRTFPYSSELKNSWFGNPLSSEFYLNAVDFVEGIISDGITSGEFKITDARKTARVIALTTSTLFVLQSGNPDQKEHCSADFLSDLVINGIRAGEKANADV